MSAFSFGILSYLLRKIKPLLEKYGMDIIEWISKESNDVIIIECQPYMYILRLITWPITIVKGIPETYRTFCIAYEDYVTYFK